MRFIGFFSIIYLLYNMAVFIIDALLYSSIWQRNTLGNLLRQRHLVGQIDASVMMGGTNSKSSRIDQQFNQIITHSFDRRLLRSLDSHFDRCHSWRPSLLPTSSQNSNSYAALLQSNETTTIQSILNRLPLLIKCTLERL